MKEQEMLDAVLKAAELKMKQKPGSVARLEAMAKVVEAIQCDRVSSLVVTWEKVTFDGEEDIFPVLKVEMIREHKET